MTYENEPPHYGEGKCKAWPIEDCWFFWNEESKFWYCHYCGQTKLDVGI